MSHTPPTTERIDALMLASVHANVAELRASEIQVLGLLADAAIEANYPRAAMRALCAHLRDLARRHPSRDVVLPSAHATRLLNNAISKLQVTR